MLDALTDWVSGSPLGYVAIAVLAWADALFPMVPGEAALFTGAILAADGSMDLWLVGVAGFVGAVVGDCSAYVLGRVFGPRLIGRLAPDGRLRTRIDWAAGQLEARGEVVILVARFVPSGRSAVAYAAGSVGFPARRFVPADAVAALAWSAYACVAGYLGGLAFQDQLWPPLLLATLMAVVVGLIAERWRRARFEG